MVDFHEIQQDGHQKHYPEQIATFISPPRLLNSSRGSFLSNPHLGEPPNKNERTFRDHSFKNMMKHSDEPSSATTSHRKDEDQNDEKGIWWKHSFAGAMAGGVSRTCTAPLDRLKVFLQVHSNSKTKYNAFQAVAHLYREGGLWSFWRGNCMNVVKIAPETALKFAAYEQIKREIQKDVHRKDLTPFDRFVAGSFAGAFSQTLIYPLEVLKTRLALRMTGDLSRGEGIIHFASKIYRREGITSFYKGFWPNLCGIMPYAGTDLAVYETIKRFYLKKNPHIKDPGPHVLIFCGIVSSTCGQLLTYPFALIRTRLQARVVSNDPSQPATALGQIRYILTHEGISGLYRGMIPNFFKVIPVVAISWVVYESTRKSLGATMT